MEARTIAEIINSMTDYVNNKNVSPPSHEHQLAMLEVMISSTMDEERALLMERIMYLDDEELLRLKMFLG